MSPGLHFSTIRAVSAYPAKRHRKYTKLELRKNTHPSKCKILYPKRNSGMVPFFVNCLVI